MPEKRNRLLQRETLEKADQLILLLKEQTGVEAVPCDHSEPILDGAMAVYDRDLQEIYYDSSLPDHIRNFTLAHEYAHVMLHPDIRHDNFTQLQYQSAVVTQDKQSLISYSPQEKREQEANSLAADLLLPLPALRKAFLQDKLTLTQIAERAEVSLACAVSQLTKLLATFELTGKEAEPSEQDGAEIKLDMSQQIAAESVYGPVFVDAGPGTGKTRTLTARIFHLIQNEQAPPQSILALTFSNKAAEEMRSRLKKLLGPQGSLPWIGTFHSFALEILRKSIEYTGFSTTPRLLEPPDALALLTSHISSLPLHLLFNPSTPSLYLPAILNNISLAKSRLLYPDDYRIQAGLLASEQDRPKALETADVYARYQTLLEQENCLDYGDLIMKTILLFEKNSDVLKSWQQDYPYLLVDEFQDISPALWRMLQLIAGNGEKLWAVGDFKQSIYGFQGAASDMAEKLQTAFPLTKTLYLNTNYRSEASLVKMLNSLASHNWNAVLNNQQNRSITWLTPENHSHQQHILCQQIREMQNNGFLLSEQAVLCRTNLEAAALAEELGSKGIPVMHHGMLFKRQQVKDMLALLTITSQSKGGALYRVAHYSRYNIPHSDVQILLDAAPEPFYKLLTSQPPPDLSPEGAKGWKTLCADLAPLLTESPWMFLAKYLFEQRTYLNQILEYEAPQRIAACNALVKLLDIAQARLFFTQQNDDVEQAASNRNEYLQHIQRIQLMQHETKTSPNLESHSTNALHILTIHQAKGLEFPVVYLPSLTNEQFKNSGRGLLQIPLFLQNTDSDTDNLFFVACSRAQTRLILLSPKFSKNKSLTPFTMLSRLNITPVSSQLLPETEKLAEESVPATNIQSKKRLVITELEQCSRCPAQYYYERILATELFTPNTLYKQFHSSLIQVIREIHSARSNGVPMSHQQAITSFTMRFGDNQDAASEEKKALLSYAENLLLNGINYPFNGKLVKLDFLDASFMECKISIPIHLAEEKPDGAIQIYRFHMRPLKPKEDHTEKRLLLLQQAANAVYPGALPILIVSLYNGDTMQAGYKRAPHNPLQTLSDALSNIQSGHFPTNPDEHNCRTCEYRILCSE